MTAANQEESRIDVKKLLEAKTAVQAVYGQVVLALSSVARYRHQCLSDLAHLVVDPLVRDCVVVASPQVSVDDQDPGKLFTPGVVAIWATVSDEIDGKIKQQIQAGNFPIRLQPQDWRSGDTVWLLDIVAPSKKLATDLLENFDQVCGADSVSLHPIIKSLVDPDVLNSLSNKSELDNAVRVGN